MTYSLEFRRCTTRALSKKALGCFNASSLTVGLVVVVVQLLDVGAFEDPAEAEEEHDLEAAHQAEADAQAQRAPDVRW